ncbi:MAG: SDR family NAD(P)-dependent oxidoreductase [Burkholderiales bacterium]
MTTISLGGKTALVTGAATGIGRAIARALGAAGARIAVNHLSRPREARQVAQEIAAAGSSAVEIDADVTSASEVARMIGRVEDALGPVDILVNNAGVILEKSLLETSEQDWDFVLNADLKAVFLCCRAVLGSMRVRASGSVINVASELGFLGRENYAAYCAAKAGVIGLTRALAREFAPEIRINAIAPGPVNTPMLSLENMRLETLERERAIPARRVGEPHEIAGTAVFLASDLASFYYGQVLSPNGGAWMG